MSGRSEVSPSRHLTPSEHAEQVDKIIQDFEKIRTHDRNKVIDGGLVGTPSSASTQGSGAAGATDWNVNVAACVVVVGGVEKEFAAQADFDIHNATVAVTNGQSRVAAIVAKNVADVVTMVAVKAAAATTGSQVAPTDDEITAAVGAANSWVKVAETTINRTGDTTVTQSYDNTKRPRLTKVDTSFGDWSSIAS